MTAKKNEGFWNDISAYSGESDSSVDEVSESDIDEGEDDELDPPALQERCMIYIYVYIVYIFIYTHNVNTCIYSLLTHIIKTI